MIRHILMDADDTLFDFLKCEATAVSETMRHFGVVANTAEVKRYSAINDAHWKRLERGEITRDEVKLGRFAKFLEPLGKENEAEAWRDYYEEALSHVVRLFPGVHDLLISASSVCDLYLASNGIWRVQKSRIADSGVAHFFKDVFISEKIGYNKPDKRFFDACFAAIPDCKKEETLIFGDSLTSDMQGGVNAGITTVWYNPKKVENTTAVKPDYEVASYEEFVRLLHTKLIK